MDRWAKYSFDVSQFLAAILISAVIAVWIYFGSIRFSMCGALGGPSPLCFHWMWVGWLRRVARPLKDRTLQPLLNLVPTLSLLLSIHWYLYFLCFFLYFCTLYFCVFCICDIAASSYSTLFATPVQMCNQLIWKDNKLNIWAIFEFRFDCNEIPKQSGI